MKTHVLIVPVLMALCIFAACSKTDSGSPDTGTKIDSSKCLLTSVDYKSEAEMPYYRDPFTLSYDSLRRLTGMINRGFTSKYSYEPGKMVQRVFLGNNTVDSNLVERLIYVLDQNNRVLHYSRAYYNKPDSEDDYNGKDSISYVYDAEGYLTNLKYYVDGRLLSAETIYTYQNGNLTQRRDIRYEYYKTPAVVIGDDLYKFTYDNSDWYPEAAYLYELELGNNATIITGKPNKNNVTGITCKVYNFYNPEPFAYTSIQYAYTTYGKKLIKADMTATTTKGTTIKTPITFGYLCK